VFGTLNVAGLGAAQQIGATGCPKPSTCVDVTPPDTTGAIGANDYIEIVNSELAVYDRNLGLRSGTPVDLSTFIGGVSVCDPQVKYDPHTSHWFMIAIRCDGTAVSNTMYLAFSKTSSAMPLSSAGWCTYSYGFGLNFPDYPKLGLDGAHIMIGDNLFGPLSTEFTAQIVGLPEPAAGTISSCPSTAAMTTFGSFGSPLMTSVGNTASTPEPATVADSLTGGYIVSADHQGEPFFGPGSNVMVWRMGGSGSSPTLTPLGAPSVTPYTLPANIPQPGSSDQIDSSDGRLTNAIAAIDPAAGGEAIWTEHTVDSDTGGTLVRWYEIVPGSPPTTRQVGSVTDSGGWAFNGAIAPTTSGGAVVNYNTGGLPQLVNIKAQSRVSAAPLGTMNSPITLASSSAVDSDFSCPSVTGKPEPCRWGDYSGASVDPSNGSLVWGSNQVNGPPPAGHASQWATQNFALFANDVPPAARFVVGSAHPVTGVPLAFNASSSSDADGPISSYRWSFGDGSTASVVAPKHTYKKSGVLKATLTVTDSGGVSSSTSLSIKVAAAKITKIKKKKKDNRAVVLKVTVNAPGVIHLGKKKKRLKRPGTTELTIKLSAKQLAALATNHTLTLKLRIKFVPAAGAVFKKTVKVRFTT
jgi:PKD repeat protein